MINDQMILYARNGLKLPITTSPIRFAVEKGNGFKSNAWGVQVEKKKSGDVDAYVYCRDGMRAQKVSLHCSGKQHISFNEDDPSMRHYTGDRFMNQWREPQYDGKAIPTLRLLFPTWGLQLSSEQRTDNQSKWDRNQVLIPGHKEMVTVVSFVIVDEGTRLRKVNGSPPAGVFGVLRLRPGKTLAAIAGYEPERDLREKADEALKKIVAMNVVPKALKELAAMNVVPKNLSICLTGYALENSAFMLPLLFRYIPAPSPA